jgi:hypothetical protein
VKLLYAVASALFCVAAPVAAPAQSLDQSLMLALCLDDYYADTTWALQFTRAARGVARCAHS